MTELVHGYEGELYQIHWWNVATGNQGWGAPMRFRIWPNAPRGMSLAQVAAIYMADRRDIRAEVVRVEES